MRLELQFEVEKPEFRSDNRSIFTSYLKNALTQCNQGNYYDRFFLGTGYKNFTYSVIFSRPDYRGEIISLSNCNFKIIFSAEDSEKTGFIFYMAFINQKHKRFPLPDGNGMVLRKIIQMQESEIISPKVIFKTVTGGGLVIRDHCRESNKDRYLTFGDDGFESLMKQALGAQAMSAGFSESQAKHIAVKPVQYRKVVVRFYGIWMDVSVGMFEMEAEPALLQYFYRAGMGSRHSMGFGLLELVTQDLL